MKCPVCSIDLKITDRQGVEVDYCPQCRGVWPDRGELDKIIERSDAARPYSDAKSHDHKPGDHSTSIENTPAAGRGSGRGFWVECSTSIEPWIPA